MTQFLLSRKKRGRREGIWGARRGVRDGVEGSSQKPPGPHPVPTLLDRGSRAGREQSTDRGGTSQDKPDGECACSCCTVRRLLLAGNWISMHACGADNATVVTYVCCF